MACTGRLKRRDVPSQRLWCRLVQHGVPRCSHVVCMVQHGLPCRYSGSGALVSSVCVTRTTANSKVRVHVTAPAICASQYWPLGDSSSTPKSHPHAHAPRRQARSRPAQTTTKQMTHVFQEARRLPRGAYPSHTTHPSHRACATTHAPKHNAATSLHATQTPASKPEHMYLARITLPFWSMCEVVHTVL